MPYPYYNVYPQNYQNYQQMPQQPVQQQAQNTGFIPAPNEMYARNYPVAPGNSAIFKDENAPYVYTKTMGFSQLDVPRFERYRLVKEETQEPQTDTQANKVDDSANYVTKSEYEALRDIVDTLQKDVETLRETSAKKTIKPKKEEGEV